MSPELPPFLQRRSCPPPPSSGGIQQAWQHWSLRRRWLPLRPAAEPITRSVRPCQARPLVLALASGLWFASGFLWALMTFRLAEPQPRPQSAQPALSRSSAPLT